MIQTFAVNIHYYGKTDKAVFVSDDLVYKLEKIAPLLQFS